MSDSVSICVDDREDGRAAHDAHISKSRYGAPGFDRRFDTLPDPIWALLRLRRSL
jgi:hypothetical protein